MRHPVTRRRFLQTTAAAAAAFTIVPRSAFGASERLNVACIGVTGRGGDDYDEVAKVENVQIVALSDVDEQNLAKGAKKRPNARTFQDYRQMLDAMRGDIDAVVVGTPDHHHAPATMRAIAYGKHVYCEKPLTHTLAECRKVREAAARAKVATQMGTQIHAENNYRRVVELIKAGAIGKVTRVHTWVTRPDGGYCGADRSPGEAPIPAGLNWDLWLGPAPERPYLSKVYHPFAWRGWWDFGGGHLSDMACHHMDLPHWALDLRYPTSVEATDGMPVHPESTPIWLTVDYHYPARGDGQPPVHLTWYHGGYGNQPKELAELAEQKEIDRKQWGAGNLFVGDKGMLIADYGKHRLLPKKDFETYERPPKSIPPSIGHHAEWVKACREGAPTTCNFDYSGALAETVLLGNVAYRLGKKIDWDGERFEAKNAPDAAKFITKEYRKGWEL